MTWVIYTEDGFDAYQVRNPLTGRHNPVFLPADTTLLDLTQKAQEGLQLKPIVTNDGARTPRFITGTIVSGDAFIASASKRIELRRRLRADVVEMEGAAVAQVCYQQEIPFLIVRSVSNSADSDVHMDTARFNEAAAHNAARYVTRMVELLEASPSSPNEAHRVRTESQGDAAR